MSPLNFSTVFDGDLPASLNPGVDFGAPVVAWTPTVSGVYQLMISAPDEPGAPFMFADNVVVDMGAPTPGIQFGLAFTGNISQELQQLDEQPSASLRLETSMGTPVRAVVKAALVASSEVGSAGDTLVVPLDELKRGLGIELSDTSEDANLVQLEAAAVAWLEEKLERRFQAPASRKEYIAGTGTRSLYLAGTVESEAADAVVVRERSASGVWVAYDTPSEVFEVRRGRRVTQLFRIDGQAWSRYLEYEVTYADGYETAPADIRALITDAVNQQRNALIAAVDEGTVKSETIGDYSYTLDLSVAAGALSSGFSSFSSDTLNRWRRVHA